MIREASAREALETLGQLLDLEVRFAPGVPATNAISMRVQDAYVADAFHDVLNVSNLSLVALDGRTATIAAKP